MVACEESAATLERAEELKLRIKTLIVVLVNSIKGKKAEEIQEELIEDVKALKRDMEYIQARLSEIANQHRILLFLFRGLNEDKVRKCLEKVDTSLEVFNLARNIEHTHLLNELERQIMIFHTEQQRSLESLQVTMDDVKAMLDERLPAAATPSPRCMRAIMPANTAIFYGRDSVVNELVRIITGAPRRHVCILGPGGMGKTSTALAVMSHPDVKSCFPDDLRIWVPCAKATCTSLFLDTLYRSLGVSKRTGNPLADILFELRSVSPSGIILLLDNFETPENANQSEVEQILRDIDQITHVTLFITMRSSAPPCGDIAWHSVHLRSVDPAAARNIYANWHHAGLEDPDLPDLLQLIGHMPLAVTLMAKFADLTNLPAQKLVKEYNRLGPSMLGQGTDAKSSMDICISLSVNSPPMAAHPEAFDLLCSISMLSTGASYDMLATLWARNLSNLAGALGVLKNTSLVERRLSTYFVLPVIQRYVLDPSRFPSQTRMSMLRSACDFLKQHASVPGDERYKSDSAALSAEHDNLEAVLLTSTVATPHLIQSLLLFTQHQNKIRPHTTTIDHALTLVRDIDDNLLRGEVLYCYGTISFQMRQFNSSLKQFEEALDLFLSVKDKKRAAECRLSQNKSARYTGKPYEFLRRNLEATLADFKSLNDQVGVGRCLASLGYLHISHRNPTPALDLLSEAERVFLKLDTEHVQYYLAETHMNLGWAYYFLGRYDLASCYSISALEKFIGNSHLGKAWLAAYSLGITMSARGDYKESLAYFIRALEIRKSMALPHPGEVLEAMGQVWLKLGNNADAVRAFGEALQQYSSEEASPNSRNGIIRSQFFLKRLEDPDLLPDVGVRSALLEHLSEEHLTQILTKSST